MNLQKVDIRLLRVGDLVKFGAESWRPFFFLKMITATEYIFEENTIIYSNVKKIKRAENPRRRKFVFVEVV